MKTYCKDMDFVNEEFIMKHVAAFIGDHIDNANVAKLFAWYNGISNSKSRKLIDESPEYTVKTEEQIVSEMVWHIKTQTVREHVLMVTPEEPLIRYVRIVDGLNQKERELGIEKLIFQLYEVVFREAAKPMFEAKIGVYQVASIKKKGQTYGKKHMVRWLERDPDGTKVIGKMDVQKCYPSVDHVVILGFLHRDIRKNKPLVYLADTIFVLYEESSRFLKRPDPEKGILIGSPAAKDLCNYFMSYLYHFATEQLSVVKKRRGVETRERLISHIMVYADDIVLTGSNKKNVGLAIQKIIQYAKDVLHLTIKSSWCKMKFAYKGKDGKEHGNILDFMGVVFRGIDSSNRWYGKTCVKLRKVSTTIRAGIFLKARRRFALTKKRFKQKKQITNKSAMAFMAFNGWIKNSDTFHFQKKEKWKPIIKTVGRIIGRYAKEKPYETEYYYKKWRKLYA